MKFILATLALAALSRVQAVVEINADTASGKALLSKARKLQDNNYNYYYNEQYYNQEGDFEYNWVSGYSLKFQGCHHISQWNDEIEDEDDVRIATKRLVRFRMCPSSSCASDSSSGCDSEYGDYIIDLNSYLAYYFEARAEYQQYNCEYLQEACGCNGDEYCMYDCYAAHNLENVCMDQNPYQNGNGQNGEQFQFQLENYMECAESGLYDENGNSLYIGPYCASQGGEIFLGVFRDEACTVFADNDGGYETFMMNTGMELPYSSTNIVDMECFSCKEPDQNNNGGNDAQDGDDVSEVCEAVYSMAGKCEMSMPEWVGEQNNNACNYMEGIKIVRKDGTVVTADARANRTAAVFIGIFVVAFVLLSAYVYYLKTKLDRASINLAE